MSAANKVVVRRLFDEFDQHRIAEELLAADYVWHASSFGIQDRDDMTQFVASVLAAFPDSRCAVEDVVAELDKVVVRWSFSGNHLGRFMGVEPTGRPVSLRGIGISRLADGKVVEGWEEWDTASLVHQLGAALQPRGIWGE